MERFWVYLDNKVLGPVEVPALRKLPGFTLLTQVCSEGQESWRMADEVIEIKAYFSSPPRGSSLVPEGQPELLSSEKNQIEMPLATSSMTLQRPDVEVLETLEEPPKAVVNGPTPQLRVLNEPAGSETLRVPCATCGYKNPRDVAICMKCGTPLKTAPVKSDVEPPPMETLPEMTAQAPVVSSPSQVASPAVVARVSQEAKPESPMVEIPVTRILIILVSVSVAGALLFTGRQILKSSHHRRGVAHTIKVEKLPPPLPAPAMHVRTTAHRRTAYRFASRPPRHLASALPGVALSPVTRRNLPVESGGDSNAPGPSYRVLARAYPLEHRTSAPLDSKYTVKRRGDRALWSGQEDAAIQQAQSYRIYGGQRTIQRNTDILMQILRDREYSQAFETGKRWYLLNDIDWSAVQKDGPQYEVRLTFSGGKEADGSPRAPLRMAFDVDLDRQTVAPGGEGTVRTNTVHAFFDESRIPPEERRSVAKDTEELVKAAQPGASPLALDTISKQFAATYSYSALSRVADAYGLTILDKKLAHETPSLTEVMPGKRSQAAAPKPDAPSAAVPVGKQALQPKLAPALSASGAIQYSMDRGEGKEKLLTVQAPSRASPAKLWEVMTGYDRLTQIVPDLLVSQREGQDGPAVIVHTVSLTRLMFFVFKVNLHLRILEHPQQHRLEFERIAGDFDKFSGYAEIVPDATGTRSLVNLHITLAPKGFLPAWIIRDMAQKFVVPVIEAVRSKAEAD